MAKQDTSKASGAGGISHHILSVERAETMSGCSGTEGNLARKGKRGGVPVNHLVKANQADRRTVPQCEGCSQMAQRCISSDTDSQLPRRSPALRTQDRLTWEEERSQGSG